LVVRVGDEICSQISCDTVNKNVETQFVRDLKGTIFSMFNEGTDLGKKYVFDVRLTFRELYDNSRRILHSKGIDTTATTHHSSNSSLSASAAADCKQIVDLTCLICMDSQINTIFLPCGHLSCCKSCSEK